MSDGPTVSAWPGSPRWLARLAHRARAVTVEGDGAAAGHCLFFGSLVAAALDALGASATWWPCALQIQRRGALICQVGEDGAVLPEGWRGHLLVATGPWLVDAGLADRYVRRWGLADAYVWPRAALEGGERVIRAGPDEWVVRHPVPLPPAPWLHPDVRAHVAAEGARIAEALDAERAL